MHAPGIRALLICFSRLEMTFERSVEASARSADDSCRGIHFLLEEVSRVELNVEETQVEMAWAAFKTT